MTVVNDLTIWIHGSKCFTISCDLCFFNVKNELTASCHLFQIKIYYILVMINSLNKEEIIKLLPHREPMLLIDELKNIKKLFSATGIVNVTKKSFFVQGHFPENPVMPGVLIVEAFG